MGKFKAIVVLSCLVTFVLFGLMLFLMKTVDPPPLSDAKEVPKTELLLESEFIRVPLHSETTVTLGPQTTVNETEGLQKDHVTENDKSRLKYSIQRVVPPIWPNIPSPPINKTVGSPKKRALNETEKDSVESTTSTINDTLSVIKRSVNDVIQLGGDLNYILLKIIDESGQFNMEIKIDLNNTVVKKKNETREDKIQSKDKSKYNISLKTKDNDQLKKTKLAKNTIIRVIPNDFVTVLEYDDHLEAKNKIKNNMIQASILDFNNITQYNITQNKATVMPIYRDVFKPIVIFYNQTKSIYHSDTKTENRDLLQKPNDACNTNHNSFKTANNTTYNVTTQTEKRNKKNEKLDLLEKLNDASDECKTNVNDSKTAYNLTAQTEKGDLFEKPVDVSDGGKIILNSFKTPNITAYNVTTQTENGAQETEKGDLLEKPNDASDGCKTNVNDSKTAYNLTAQTEKGDLFEKPNDVSDGGKINFNSFKTPNNTEI